MGLVLLTIAVLVLALCDDLKTYIGYEAFARHFKDIIDYRANDYYKRRYDKNKNNGI